MGVPEIGRAACQMGNIMSPFGSDNQMKVEMGWPHLEYSLFSPTPAKYCAYAMWRNAIWVGSYESDRRNYEYVSSSRPIKMAPRSVSQPQKGLCEPALIA